MERGALRLQPVLLVLMFISSVLFEFSTSKCRHHPHSGGPVALLSHPLPVPFYYVVQPLYALIFLAYRLPYCLLVFYKLLFVLLLHLLQLFTVLSFDVRSLGPSSLHFLPQLPILLLDCFQHIDQSASFGAYGP